MQVQLGLMGFEPEPQSLDSLFFAINPDLHTTTLVAGLRKQLIDRHGLKGTLIGTKLFHITMLDLGLFVADKAERARRAAETVVVAPADIVLDRVLSFPASKAFVLSGGSDDNTALAALRQNLEVALRRQGLRAKPIKTPHLTLMYCNQVVEEHAIEPIRWTANEFTLIRSHVGQTLHEFLGSWPLRA